MLGINLLFAGFALTLNGISYLTKIDDRARGAANALVGFIIAFNAIFQTAAADGYAAHGFAAAMWLFAINYFIIAAHILFKADNWKAFGLYSLFASIVSFVFAGDVLINSGPWEMIYLWAMWGILWVQSFLSILCGIKAVDKLTPHVLILNGIASTFVPGFLILLGVILN
jgi:hypothetical protein